jgi:hypothetical protein
MPNQKIPGEGIFLLMELADITAQTLSEQPRPIEAN